MKMAEVVAQFVDRLLLTPEVHSSNLVIGKLLYRTFVYCLLYWKNKDKEKEAVNGPFKNCCEKTKRRPEKVPIHPYIFTTLQNSRNVSLHST